MEELVYWIADLVDFLNTRNMRLKDNYQSLECVHPEQAVALREALTCAWEEREERGGMDSPLPSGYNPELGTEVKVIQGILLPQFKAQVSEALGCLSEQLKVLNEQDLTQNLSGQETKDVVTPDRKSVV